MKGIKKIISSLLVVCMVCGVAFSNVTTREVQATENAEATERPENLRKLSLENFGITAGKKLGSVLTTESAPGTLLNTEMTLNVKPENTKQNDGIVEPEEPTGPDTYTVTLSKAMDLYLSNNIVPEALPVTLTYTVQAGANQQDLSGVVSGFMATDTPEDLRSPYTGYGGVGTMKAWTWVRLMAAERTYKFELNLDSQGNITYKEWKIETDGTETLIDPSSYVKSYGTGNLNATHFGIWIGHAAGTEGQNATLTNVTCVDAAGNDLGVMVNATAGECKAIKDVSEEPQEPDTYTVTLSKAKDLYLSNNIVPEALPVTLTYTVQAGANQQSLSGVVSAVMATSDPQDTRSPYYGGVGSMLGWTWVRLMTAEKTFKLEIGKDAQGNTTYKEWKIETDGTETPVTSTTNVTAGTDTNATHFGIWIGHGGPDNQNAVLTNVTCVDAAGNDLGVMVNAAAGECKAIKDVSEEPQEPDTYTVTLSKAKDLYLSNNIVPEALPVTLTYTVQAGANQQSLSGVVSAVMATSDPQDTRSPYYGGVGSMLGWTWVRLMTAEKTFKLELGKDAQGNITYKEWKIETDGTETPVTSTTNVTAGTDTNATYFGIWIGHGGPDNQNAVLTNVTCVDAAGNDLGVMVNATAGECKAIKDVSEEPQELGRYTVMLNNAKDLYLSNNIVPEALPVTLTYTVQPGANQHNLGGVVSAVMATSDPQDTRSPYYGGVGSMLGWTWVRLMTAEKTFKLELGKDAQGNITYKEWKIETDGTETLVTSTTNVTAGTDTNATHFGIWIGHGGPDNQNAVLTNVTCVDAAGNDLGVMVNAAAGECEILQGTPISIRYAVQKGNQDINGNSYGGSDCGINIDILEEGNMRVHTPKTNWMSEAVTITPEEVGFKSGCTFSNTEFVMSLYLVSKALDGDAQYNDVQFQLWIGDKQVLVYDFKDLPTIEEYDAGVHSKMPLGNKMNMIVITGEDTGIASVQFTNPKESTDSFEEITLNDMNGSGITQQDYYNENELVYSGTPVSEGSLNGKIFKTSVRFSGKNAEIYYGASGNSQTKGLKIGLDSYGDTLYFTSTIESGDVGGRPVVDAGRYIQPGVAGVDVIDNTFELGISIRKVDSNGDNEFNDAEVGLWFEGTLYNNSYIYLSNVAEYLKPNLGVKTGNSGRVVIGTYTQETPTDIAHCADEFAYFADGDAVNVNGEEKGTSWNTSKPDVYMVTYKDSVHTLKEKVTVYKTNDVTADGVVDVKDLVALKKLVAGKREDTVAPGLKAVTVNKNSGKAEQKAALKAMREQFLASKNTIGAKEFSEEIIGQLGQEGAEQSTWITNVDMTEQGTSVLSLSNVGNSTYQSDLTDLNGSGLDFILDFEQDKEIKVLQLTDTQVIVSNYLGDAWKDGQQDTVLYNELRALLAQEKPDLVLITGDVVYGRYDHDGQQLQKLIEVMDSCKVPWAPIFGNHDNESDKGVAWQCEQLENSKYCLFNRRNEIGGNGNYAIGISVKGELQRTIFMMDSNGCNGPSNSNTSSWDGNRKDIKTSFGFTPNQIAWYRTTAAKANAFAGNTLPSFFCMHIQPAELTAALVAKGYQVTHDVEGKVKYTFNLGNEFTGDFGIKNNGIVPQSRIASVSDYILPYLKAAGTDGTFFGHEHTNSLSVEWDGIRWTYGLKTGKYDASPTVTGGTSIMFDSNDSSNFTVQHVSVQ